MNLGSVFAQKNEKANAMAGHREYWIIYRGPGFIAIVWFGSSPNPFPPLPSQSFTADTQKAEKERQRADGRKV